MEVAGHVTVMEFFERYRGAEDPAVKAHLQVIWLKAQGWGTREVAWSTGFKTDRVPGLVKVRKASGTAERTTAVADPQAQAAWEKNSSRSYAVFIEPAPARESSSGRRTKRACG